MIFEGKIIGEFVGAIPKPQIIQWLMKHLPDLENTETSTNDDAEVAEVDEKLPEPDEVLPQITQVPDPEFIMYLDDYISKNPESEKAKVYKAHKGYILLLL